MPLRIAFDLDGVLADMDGELVRHAEALFGAAVAPRPNAATDEASQNGGGPAAADAIDAATAEATGEAGVEQEPPASSKVRMTSRQTRRLWRHVQTVDNFWGTLVEVEPGVIERLAMIAADRRWEVIFLTKRPECAGATSQVQTQRWLEAKGFPLPSVYVVQGSRGRIAAALDLDFVVDDRPENCLDVVIDSKARAILVWRDDQNQLPAAAKRLGIGVVGTVGECLDILTELDAPPAERPKIMDRVMRLLGLKEKSA